MKTRFWGCAVMATLCVGCSSDDETSLLGGSGGEGKNGGTAGSGGTAAGGEHFSGGTQSGGTVGTQSGGTGGSAPASGGSNGDAAGGTSGGAGNGTGGGDLGASGGGQDMGGEPVFPQVAAEPSAGCSAMNTPMIGQQDLSVEGEERSFIVSLPDSYDGSHPYPLVFAFHGLGGSGQLVSGRFYFGLEEAEGPPMIFVYPDGLEVQNGGGAGWDNQDGRDVAFFDAMLDALDRDACLDRNRIFATGHSYGGMMTHTLACQRSEMLRAVAPVAGAHFGRGECSGPVAAWGTHGTNDETVDYSAGESAMARILDTNGCDAAVMMPYPPTEDCVSYACEDGYPTIWCPHEQNHDWPNFASQAIVDFFARF